MILICEDQEPEGARACPGYAAGRRGARGYPRDLTDAQWQVIAPHLPAQARAAGQAADLAGPPDRGGYLVPGPDRVRLAAPAGEFPALADRLRVTFAELVARFNVSRNQT